MKDDGCEIPVMSWPVAWRICNFGEFLMISSPVTFRAADSEYPVHSGIADYLQVICSAGEVQTIAVCDK